MNRVTYTLEKYAGIKSRHTCPSCGVKNQFSRYVDSEGNHIADHVGRCNRESKCGYHLHPTEYYKNNPGVAPLQPSREAKPEPVKPIQYISPDVLKATLKAYERNTFVKYLHTIFDAETVQAIIDTYGIGTTKDGSCIFWQVDTLGLIRTGKVIRYGTDGHRDKTIPPYFIHTRLGTNGISQCLFGMHILKVINAPIGLVESEKTACIMSGKLPQYIWMATGGKSNLSKVDALKGQKVIAFPDTDAFDAWTERLSPYGFKISDALQKRVTDPGYDLADFVTRAQDYIQTLSDGRVIQMHSAGYPKEWNLNKTRLAI